MYRARCTAASDISLHSQESRLNQLLLWSWEIRSVLCVLEKDFSVGEKPWTFRGTVAKGKKEKFEFVHIFYKYVCLYVFVHIFYKYFKDTFVLKLKFMLEQTFN